MSAQQQEELNRQDPGLKDATRPWSESERPIPRNVEAALRMEEPPLEPPVRKSIEPNLVSVPRAAGPRKEPKELQNPGEQMSG